MSKDYYQMCKLRQATPNNDGYMYEIAWIESKGAKIGASVELIGEEGFWEVISTDNEQVPVSRIRSKQAADRKQRQASDI